MITLLTDFGLSDPYVGIMKGVILSVNPVARIVDLTHEIPPQDISAAAYAASSAFPYFPASTIHVVVVDPGVGGGRGILAVVAAGHVFLAPDNGVLTLVLKNHPTDAVFRVENSRYFRHPVSRTFHGRDIFAPIAGHLSAGLPPERLGPRLGPDQWVVMDLPVPRASPGREIVGEVVGMDRFGNLITNIERELLDATFGGTDPRAIVISVGGMTISGLSDTYQEAPAGALLALSGSTGCIEIAINGGSAASDCHAGRGTPVIIAPDKQLSDQQIS